MTSITNSSSTFGSLSTTHGNITGRKSIAKERGIQGSQVFSFKSGCQRKPGKILKMSTEGGQQNKFILTS